MKRKDLNLPDLKAAMDRPPISETPSREATPDTPSSETSDSSQSSRRSRQLELKERAQLLLQKARQETAKSTKEEAPTQGESEEGPLSAGQTGATDARGATGDVLESKDIAAEDERKRQLRERARQLITETRESLGKPSETEFIRKMGGDGPLARSVPLPAMKKSKDEEDENTVDAKSGKPPKRSQEKGYTYPIEADIYVKDEFDPNSIVLVQTLQLLNQKVEEQDHKLLKDIVSRIANESVSSKNYSVFKEYVRRFVNGLGFSEKFSVNETEDIFNILIEIWENPKFASYVLKKVYNEDVSDAVIPIGKEISDQLPEDVQQLDPKAITLFYKALKDGKEKVNNIRLMVLGMCGVGKTSLVKNLIRDFRKKLSEPLSTEGIDVHRCKLTTDGDWFLDKELKVVRYEYRMQKVVTKNTNPATSANDEIASSHDLFVNTVTSSKDHETQTQSEPLQTIKEKIALHKEDDIVGLKFAKMMVETSSDHSEKRKALLDESKNEVTVSVWDFAGQPQYYSTHQFFLNKRSIYIVVMDMTKELKDAVGDSEEIGIWCGSVDDCTYLDIFKFWLNAIHMNSDYQSKTQQRKTIKKTVILVGTRKDKMKGNDLEEKENIMNSYFDNALFSFDHGSPIFEHIYPKRFLVDNLTPNDSAFAELRKEIVSLAAEQDYWGEEYPVRWIHMEQTLDKMRDEKRQIEHIKTVEEEDLKNLHPLGKEELTLFLEIQHKQGNIIFFNTGELKNFVVLAPQWIIEAFRCFIPHNQKIESTVLKDWEEYIKHAILKPNVLLEVMKNSPPYIHEYKNAVVRYMEYLNVIAKPVTSVLDITGVLDQQKRVCEETSGIDDHNPTMLDCHIVPCLLRFPPPPLKKFTSPDIPRTPVLAFVFCGKFMPPSFFHRLVAVCIRAWPISKESNLYCLFNGLAIFALNSSSTYTLRIWYRDFIIYARIACYSKNAKLEEFVWLFQGVRHKLEKSLHDFVCQSSSEFEEYIQCPNMQEYIHNEGLLRVAQFKYETEIFCSYCSIPHTVKQSDALKHWFKEWLDQKETDDN